MAFEAVEVAAVVEVCDDEVKEVLGVVAVVVVLELVGAVLDELAVVLL